MLAVGFRLTALTAGHKLKHNACRAENVACISVYTYIRNGQVCLRCMHPPKHIQSMLLYKAYVVDMGMFECLCIIVHGVAMSCTQPGLRCVLRSALSKAQDCYV